MRVMLRSGAGRVGVALLPDHSCRNELVSGRLTHRQKAVTQADAFCEERFVLVL
jgi:hypothetical protein